MLLAVWIGLALGIAATIAGAVVTVSRGLRAWRTVKRLMRHVSDGLEELAKRAAATEEKALAATEHSAKLAAAVARLQRSLAVLAVLQAAAAEAGSGPGDIRKLLRK